MREITVPVPGLAYPIRIEAGALRSLGSHAREAGLRGKVALVYDDGVPAGYQDAARASLEAAGFPVAVIPVPSGEGSKSLSQLGRLYDAFASAELDRASAVVALGGGVVGDLAGFAAASYVRGIDFVQVPTTLLAQVDASVGGKTGIDLPAGKNLAGAFHQPKLVLVDLDTLSTLPTREYLAGLAEVVKYGVIWDRAFFDYLAQNRQALLDHQPDVLSETIARCCEIKAEVVGKDERESGLRGILNYGHTVGHGVETVAGYGAYLHGEAVAIGMAAAGFISERQLGLNPMDREAITALLSDYGLPTRLARPLDEDALVAAMRLDKKTRGGQLRFILAREIGQVEMTPVDEALAREALRIIAPAS